MTTSLTNFKAISEDLADIYIDKATVEDEVTISEDLLSQTGLDAVYAKSLWSWGLNSTGQLGIDTITSRSSPVQVGALTDWKVVDLGRTHCLAVKTDSTLWAWGRNAVNGPLGLNNLTNRSSPVQVGLLTDWKYVSASIAATAYSSLAVKTDGTLWAWGGNTDGRLGLNGGVTVHRSSPVQVGSLNNWKYVSSSGHSASVKTDGTLWTWGLASSGQLGHNNTTARSSPVQVGALTTWKYVTAGALVTFATQVNGTLWAWGSGASGTSGLGDVVNRSSPVQIGALTDWGSVSSNTGSASVVKTDGTLWVWGLGTDGELGLNAITSSSSPTQVGSLNDWYYVSSGVEHTASIKTDGSLWIWGLNTDGALGFSDLISRSSPVQLGSLTNWHRVSVGNLSTVSRKS